MVTELNNGHKSQSDGARQLTMMMTRSEESVRAQETALLLSSPVRSTTRAFAERSSTSGEAYDYLMMRAP